MFFNVLVSFSAGLQNWTLIYGWWECKRYRHFEKQFDSFLQGYMIQIPSPVPNPKDIGTMPVHKCLKATLFLTAPNQTQSSYLSPGQGITNFGGTMQWKYYWTVKRELPANTTWMALTSIPPSERSQTQKATESLIPYIWHSGKGTTTEKKRDQWLLGVTV